MLDIRVVGGNDLGDSVAEVGRRPVADMAFDHAGRAVVGSDDESTRVDRRTLGVRAGHKDDVDGYVDDGSTANAHKDTVVQERRVQSQEAVAFERRMFTEVAGHLSISARNRCGQAADLDPGSRRTQIRQIGHEMAVDDDDPNGSQSPEPDARDAVGTQAVALVAQDRRERRLHQRGDVGVLPVFQARRWKADGAERIETTLAQLS